MRRVNVLAAVLVIAGLISTVAWSGEASAAGPGLKFPAPVGTQWEVLAGYNTPTHTGVDPYALDLWRIDGPTGGTPLLAPMSGTVGYNSDSCISIRTSDLNLLMCHVHALPELQRGQTVTVGQQIGTVANDGEAGNGGTAHIHLQLNARTSGASSTGESIPYAGDFALEGQSLAAIATFNGYAGVRFTSTNDPSLDLPRVNAAG
ncbi:MAG: M23 family metallopeptidase, partial [Chloroflexi bacterium]|nr:M23 family metallopeptidase [Chloroflexota bacterium]